MKILYITPDISNAGGIARILALKSSYFVKIFNYEVTVFAPNSDKNIFFYDFDKQIQWESISYSKNSILFLIKYIAQIKKVIANKNPDVIIICDAVLWLFIPWFISTKIPIIFETHVSKWLRKNDKQNRITKLKCVITHFLKQITLKQINKVVFLTIDGQNEWNIHNATIIKNPIAFNASKTALLDNKIVIVVSRHSYEKGIDRTLLIWQKIIKKHPNWTLTIYGAWETNYYQELANNLNIANTVRFFAPTNNIQECYLESSIYLMTSRSEAFGLVLIEAMYSGLPCIAYDCPTGPRNIITNNVNGFLINDGDEVDFIEKLDLLMSNESKRKELGNNAQKNSAQYNIDIIMQQWKNLIETIVPII